MENKGKEIEIVPESKEVAPIADDQLLAIADQAEKRIEAVNRIKRIALQVTNVHDWTDQGGRPYLDVSGAEKVARLFGISWRIDEPHLVTEEDGHFRYEYKAYFTLGAGGPTIEAIGVRGSKDPWFSKNKGIDIPPSEIDKGDVKKSAFTNCIGNGITRLLGIRNMTWEDLATAGIAQDKVARVSYRTSDVKLSPAQQKKIAVMKKEGIEAGAFDEASYYETLDKRYHLKHSSELSKKDASDFIDRMTKEINKALDELAEKQDKSQSEPEEEIFQGGEKQ